MPPLQIQSFPRAIVEPQPTRPEGIAPGVSADVTLRVGIDRTGVVRAVRVVKSADRIFDQEALDAMSRARFVPALDRAGQPVDCEISWVLRFQAR